MSYPFFSWSRYMGKWFRARNDVIDKSKIGWRRYFSFLLLLFLRMSKIFPIMIWVLLLQSQRGQLRLLLLVYGNFSLLRLKGLQSQIWRSVCLESLEWPTSQKFLGHFQFFCLQLIVNYIINFVENGKFPVSLFLLYFRAVLHCDEGIVGPSRFFLGLPLLLYALGLVMGPGGWVIIALLCLHASALCGWKGLHSWGRLFRRRRWSLCFYPATTAPSCSRFNCL